MSETASTGKLVAKGITALGVGMFLVVDPSIAAHALWHAGDSIKDAPKSMIFGSLSVFDRLRMAAFYSCVGMAVGGVGWGLTYPD